MIGDAFPVEELLNSDDHDGAAFFGMDPFVFKKALGVLVVGVYVRART